MFEYIFLSFLLLFFIFTSSMKNRIIKIILFLLVALILTFSIFFIQADTLISKGNDNISMIEQFYLFISMIVGMFSHYFFYGFGKTKFKFSFTKMIRPLFISPIVFLSIYYISNESKEITLLLYLFSFQNGFFWQTILDKEQKSILIDNKT